MVRAPITSAETKGKSATIEAVVARSAVDGGKEEAWVSLHTENSGLVLVVEFKSEDYGKEGSQVCQALG
jgi:hypothetical protein